MPVNSIHEKLLAQVVMDDFSVVRDAAGRDERLSKKDMKKAGLWFSDDGAVGDILRYFVEEGRKNGKKIVTMQNPLGDGRSIDQVAEDFIDRVIAYDRYLHDTYYDPDVPGTPIAKYEQENVWVKRARNRTDSEACELEAAQYGPGRLPHGTDRLSKSKRIELVRTAMEDYDDYDREVLLKSLPNNRSLPRDMKNWVSNANRAMRHDPETFFEGQFDTFCEVYKGKTDHTLVGYVAMLNVAVDGYLLRRNAAFDVHGGVLFDETLD